MPVPGVAGGASVVSARNMWAVGPTTATAGKAGSKQVYIAMHWNGTKCAAASLPVPAPLATALLHWDGSTWAMAAQDPGVDLGSGMTGDGTGGLWLAGSDTQTSYLVHFAGGTFTPQAVPAEAGYDGEAGPLAQVPGATSVWGSARCSPPAAASTKPKSCVTAADQAACHAGSGRRDSPAICAPRPGPHGPAPGMRHPGPGTGPGWFSLRDF